MCVTDAGKVFSWGLGENGGALFLLFANIANQWDGIRYRSVGSRGSDTPILPQDDCSSSRFECHHSGMWKIPFSCPHRYTTPLYMRMCSFWYRFGFVLRQWCSVLVGKQSTRRVCTKSLGRFCQHTNSCTTSCFFTRKCHPGGMWG
jgi:hypothetical protein